jgi:AcrR family transcriptional regulator
MGSKERRDRERQDTRDRILDAARGLFVERGVEATTMRAIADRLEYTAPAIYHHFADKEALLRELVTCDLRRLGSVFQKVGQIADPIERMKQLGMAYVQFGVEHPQHYRLLFMTPEAKAGGLDEEIHCEMTETPEQDAYLILHVTVTHAIEAGRLGPEYQDPDQVAQICWAAVHGLVSLHVVFSGQSWIEWKDVSSSAERMLDAMVAGMQVGAAAGVR